MKLYKHTLTSYIEINTETSEVKKKIVTTLNDLGKDEHCNKYHCNCNGSIKDILTNEVKALEKLKKYKNFPKIINVDQTSNTITMTYCGVTLRDLSVTNKRSIRRNYKKLIADAKLIDMYLSKEKIQHYDVCANNLCMKDNTLYLIDFVCYNKNNKHFIEGQVYKDILYCINRILNKDNSNYKKNIYSNSND